MKDLVQHVDAGAVARIGHGLLRRASVQHRSAIVRKAQAQSNRREVLACGVGWLRGQGGEPSLRLLGERIPEPPTLFHVDRAWLLGDVLEVLLQTEQIA